MKKEINLKLIIAMVFVALLFTGLYVCDFFWVESYQAVPIYFQHAFGNDLARYIVYDHVVTGVFMLAAAAAIDLVIYVGYLKLKSDR